MFHISGLAFKDYSLYWNSKENLKNSDVDTLVIDVSLVLGRSLRNIFSQWSHITDLSASSTLPSITLLSESFFNR